MGRRDVMLGRGERPGAAYWLLPALLSGGALAVLAVAAMTVAFDWEFYVGEALNSHFADRLARTGVLYDEWTATAPYFPIYPPGFYVLLAPFQLLDAEAIWQGRLLSVAGFAGAGAAAYAVARRLGCSSGEAVVSATAFLFISVTGLLVAAARPDGIGLGLVGGAVWAATLWEERRRRRALWAAALLTAAFVVVKYNFAPIGLGVALAIWLRDRRAAYSYAAVAALACLFAFALAEALSAGAFLANTRDFGNGYSLSSLRAVLDGIVDSAPGLLLAVAAAEAGLAIAGRQVRAVHLAFAGSLIVILSAVKIGASLNYLAPAALLGSMLLGPALLRVRRSAGARVALVASLALALTVTPSIYERVRDLGTVPDGFSVLDEANTEAATRLAAAPSPVFGDRNDLTISAGKGPVFDNIPMTLLAADGTWDTASLIEMARNREFGMVQASFDLQGPIPAAGGSTTWPPELVEALRGEYCETWRAAVSSSAGPGLWLYEPCPAARDATRP